MKLGQLSHDPVDDKEINIGPLIDIVFILLIFFMVTTTFSRDQEVKLNRPQAQSALPSDAQALRVVADKRGGVRVDGQRVNPWMVQSKVREVLANRANRQVLVVADEGLSTGDLVELVDGCRLAGAEDVAVAVQGKGP